MVISRVIIRVTPFRALITLLRTYLLSPLPLQVWVILQDSYIAACGFRGRGFGLLRLGGNAPCPRALDPKGVPDSFIA